MFLLVESMNDLTSSHIRELRRHERRVDDFVVIEVGVGAVDDMVRDQSFCSLLRGLVGRCEN